MHVSIPQELLDHIVDFAYNDRQTLRIIRLVNPAWNISARVHFFRELDLLIPRTFFVNTYVAGKPYLPVMNSELEGCGVDKFRKLLDIFNVSPDITDLVREVIIGNTTGLDQAQWKIYDPLLSDLVARLKRVKTIYVREVNWSRLSPSFATSVADLFQSPQLRSLDVWNCQMPSVQVLMDFLNSSYALTGLRLSHIRFSDDLDEAKALLPGLDVTNKTESPEWPKKPLQRLYIETVPLAPILHALLTTTPCSIDITKLQNLYLDHIDDIPSVRQFLQVVGDSLQSLEMWASTCQSRCSATQGTIDLSEVPHLKYVRVSGLQWTPSMSPAECLRPFFQGIDTPHSLESLNIVTTARKRKTDEFSFTQWSALDEILSRPVFCALQKVQVVVYSPFICFSSSDADRLTNAFHRLQANRKVHVMCM